MTPTGYDALPWLRAEAAEHPWLGNQNPERPPPIINLDGRWKVGLSLNR